jgi:excisionase family DNA binding protein
MATNHGRGICHTDDGTGKAPRLESRGGRHLQGWSETRIAGLSIKPRLITIPQAAAYCSCSIWAIRQAIWSKELAECKIGKRFLIDRSNLDRFIDARLRERA